MKNIIVTGGSGFIGSTLVRRMLEKTDARIVNIDCETYASTPETNRDLLSNPRYAHLKLNICDRAAVNEAIRIHQPAAVFHLAAESHVDRSISGSDVFIQTNIMGTFHLLEAARALPAAQKDFRFIHVSTDEVYGSIDDGLFSETSPQHPNSPYAASKAASDMLAMAWGGTYGFPVIITNCSNNYGPRQFPEKLIPLMILNALHGKPLPVYGDGQQVRDWIHAEDHADALLALWQKGKAGRRYNISAGDERVNMETVESICAILDRLIPGKEPRRNLIRHVTDRPNHDRRYATDAALLRADTGWRPRHDFGKGLEDTVRWYIDNPSWWEDLYAKLTPPSFLREERAAL